MNPYILDSTVLVEDTKFHSYNPKDMCWDGVNFVKASAEVSEYEAPVIRLFGQGIDERSSGQEIVLSFHTALQLRNWLNKLEGDKGFIQKAIIEEALSHEQILSLSKISQEHEGFTPGPLNLNEHLDEPEWDTSTKSDKNGE